MSQEQWFFKGEKIRGQCRCCRRRCRNPAALKKRDFDRDDELALIHPDCGDQRGAAAAQEGEEGKGEVDRRAAQRTMTTLIAEQRAKRNHLEQRGNLLS